MSLEIDWILPVPAFLVSCFPKKFWIHLLDETPGVIPVAILTRGTLCGLSPETWTTSGDFEPFDQNAKITRAWVFWTLSTTEDLR